MFVFLSPKPSENIKQQCANKNPEQKNRFTLNVYNIEAVNREKAKSSHITKLGISPPLTAFIISPYVTKQLIVISSINAKAYKILGLLHRIPDFLDSLAYPTLINEYGTTSLHSCFLILLL